MNLKYTRNVSLAIALCFGLFSASALAAGSGAKGSSTPPTDAGEWGLVNDFSKINQQWDSILVILKKADYFAIQEDAVSLWSCGQQAGHLALTMIMLGDAVHGLLENPAQNVDGVVSGEGKALLGGGGFPRGVAQAPDGLKPGETTAKALRATLKEARKKWKALEKKAEDIAACMGRSEHPLGMLPAKDWVRLAAVHNAHHLKIVRDILKAAGDDAGEFGAELK